MDKSYVTLEQNICVVCGDTYDTGSLLMDRRLRDTFEKHTTTGYGMCPEHQKLKEDGYVALIGADESKSSLRANGNMNPEDAHRTGNIAHLRTEAWENIMDTPVPDKMMCFCGDDVIELLKTKTITA